MKTKLISMLLLLSFIISCKKDEQSNLKSIPTQVTDTSKNLSLAQVKDWYGENVNAISNVNNLNAISTTGIKKSFNYSSLTFSWDNLQSVSNNKGNYWIGYLGGQPTFKKVKQGYRKIAFMKDSTGEIQSRILEIIPDGLYYQLKQKVTKADFTGRIFIYDQQYNLVG